MTVWPWRKIDERNGEEFMNVSRVTSEKHGTKEQKTATPLMTSQKGDKHFVLVYIRRSRER